MSQLDFYRTIFGAKWRDRQGCQSMIAKIQIKRLDQLLETAKTHVPFQARRIEKHAKRKSGFDALTAIEPVGKPEMSANFVESVNQNQLGHLGVTTSDLETLAEAPKTHPPWYQNKILIANTSGTTGETFIVLNTRKTWATQRAAVFSRTCRHSTPLIRLNPLRQYRLTYLVVKDPNSVSFRAAFDSAKANSAFAKVNCVSIDDSLENLTVKVKETRPDFLHSYPNYLEALAKRQLSGNDLGFQPEVISSGGDMLRPEQKEVLAAAFPNSKIVNHYGATECLPIANSCKLGHLHLNSDFTILEAVDENEQPIANGEFSDHALITNLINDFQPMIRYRLTDRIRILDEPCKCGCPFPIIEIQGRGYQQFHVTDNHGQPISIDSLALQSIMLKIKNVASFLIEYHQKNHVEISIAFQSNCDQEQRLAELNRHLKTLACTNDCDQAVQFSINIVDDHAPTPDNYKKKLFDVTYQPN